MAIKGEKGEKGLIMRFGLTILGGWILLFGTASAQTSLTIYNDGRVLVRRTLPIQVPSGSSTHRLAVGLLYPGSVFSLDPGVVITRSSFDAAVDEANTMRRAIGKTLVFERGMRGVSPDTVVAEVLGVDPERFRLPDGRIVFQRPGVPRYPEEVIQIDPTLTLGVQSRAARTSLPLGYFTDGSSWSAAYHVVLGKSDARVEGNASIPNERLSIDDAEVQLLAGEVGRGRQPPMLRRAREEVAMAMQEKVAMEEEVGEAHLYTLPGRITLRPSVTTTVALFEPVTVQWERHYVVRGEVPWIGPLGQTGDEGVVPVEVHYLIRRSARGQGFADLPLPAGTWRLYEPDAASRPQMVGEAMARHTAAGQDVRLSAGTAFDLTARRIQTDYTTRRDSLRTRVTASYRVSIANAKDSAVTVDVLEERQGEWRVLESSVPAERVSSTQTRFRIRVPAKGEAVLTYRVLVIW